MALVGVLIPILAVVCTVFIFRRRMSRTRLENTVTYYQTRALQIARCEFDSDLDFTDLSLVEVDRILDEIGRRYHEEKFDPTEYACAFGFYVGEVIRRAEGEGVWARDHEQFGAMCYPIYVRETAAFPLAWCWKRIENGPDDNLVHKMNVMRHAA